MAIRNVIDWDDERFRKISREVTKFDERLWTLLDDMRETLEKVQGYGCAGVHLGVLKRAVVVLADDGVIELINPVISHKSDEMQVVTEGSIAYGAPRGEVRRPRQVTVNAQDRFGKPVRVTGEDFLAATLCHEIDHLDGILFSDKIIEGNGM